MPCVRNISSPFSLSSSSMSVCKSGFPSVSVPLSVQTLCLRPTPVNRSLPGSAGVAALRYFQQPLVFCTRCLCLWVLSGSVYRMYSLALRKPSAPSGMGRTWSHLLSPGCLPAQCIGQPLPGPALNPWLAVPQTFASCGFGLPCGTRIKSRSCMAQSLPIVTIKDTLVWEPKMEKPLECSLKSFEEH